MAITETRREEYWVTADSAEQARARLVEHLSGDDGGYVHDDETSAANKAYDARRYDFTGKRTFKVTIEVTDA